MNRDAASIIDILKASRLILSFISNIHKEDFLHNKLVQSAVMHQLLIIGEAVKRLSDSFKKDVPEIPWRLIAGMRDKLIHAYDVIDVNEVWNTAYSDIPQLINTLEKHEPKR